MPQPHAPPAGDFLYDVFISYAEADRAWVERQLVPALQTAGLKVLVEDDLPPGALHLKNLEDAVTQSRHILAVLTPAWLADAWRESTGDLARALDPAARRRKLIPLLLQSCALPPDLARLQRVDLSRAPDDPRGMRRVVRGLLARIPPPSPWQPTSKPSRNQAWRRWLWWHRWRCCGGLVSWIAISITLGIFPFLYQDAWAAYSPPLAGAWRLALVGDQLLVAGRNATNGGAQANCDALKVRGEYGIWISQNDGQPWTAPYVPVEFPSATDCKELAGIWGFAMRPDMPTVIYALTDRVGVLRTLDRGASWQRTGNDPAVADVRLGAVHPYQEQTVVVATRQSGLYRSKDGGATWQRLDRQPQPLPCTTGQVLTQTLTVGGMTFAENLLVVGTGDPNQISLDHVPAGLYLSRDEGNCWEQIEGSSQEQYSDLIAWATPTRTVLLFAIKDWSKHKQANSIGVYQLDIAPQRTQRRLLWSSTAFVSGLYVSGDAHRARWYVGTKLGQLATGWVDAPGANDAQALPWFVPCLAPCSTIGWASADPDDAPFLLAAERVYRLQPGSWWRKIWP